MAVNYDYESDLNRLKEAQKQSAIADLQNTRDQALSNLNAESQKNASSYNTQRSSANVQNRLSAKNFQEYLATTGRANSGLSAQARMQNANNLQTSLNTLNAGEAAANADINRRRTDAENSYSSGIASANATIESNYIQNLLNERQKAFEREQAELNRQLQERQFAESVRQFNENLALQREQLYKSFSRGSGGGSSSKKRGTSNSNDVVFTDTPSNDVKISSVSSPAKFSSSSAANWYSKNAQNLKSKSKLDSAISKGLSSGKITKADATRIYASYGIK